MKIDLPKITPNRGVEATAELKGVDAQPQVKEGLRPLFGESLRIEEKPTTTFDSLNGVDLDEVEKELNRDDALGKLMSSHLNWEPPQMPNFV